MINSPLYHEIAIASSSINDNVNYVYNPLYGSFYNTVYIPDNDQDYPLGNDYTGSVIFEISRYRFANTFAEDQALAFGDPDRIGANILEMFISVEPIGVNFNTGPFTFTMISSAVTHASNGDEYTEGAVSSEGINYPFSFKEDHFNEGGDWNLFNVIDPAGYYDNAGNPTQTFNIVYNNLNQTFQLKWWMSKQLDPFIVRGNYLMY